jgi:hypothetical protein
MNSRRLMDAPEDQRIASYHITSLIGVVLCATARPVR